MGLLGEGEEHAQPGQWVWGGEGEEDGGREEVLGGVGGGQGGGRWTHVQSPKTLLDPLWMSRHDTSDGCEPPWGVNTHESRSRGGWGEEMLSVRSPGSVGSSVKWRCV